MRSIKTFQINLNGSVQPVYSIIFYLNAFKIIKIVSKFIYQSLDILLSNAEFEYKFNNSFYIFYKL
jgi:hypothetical protein